MKKRIFALLLSILALIILISLFTACSPDDEDPYDGDNDDDDVTPTYYTVTFDTNGAGNVQSQSVENGKKVTSPTTPTKTGYTLDGWYYLDNKWNFDTDTVSGDITLKAVWVPTVYKADFYADGDFVETVSFTIEDESLPTMPAVPNKNGYSGVWESYTLGPQNITVNASYSIITYTITYNNLNGATHSNQDTYNVTSPTITLQPLTSADSVFDGWYDTQGTKVAQIETGSYGNIILTARWSRKLTVSFNVNGAITPTPEKQLVASGTKATKPANPTKQHYDFVGWYNGTELWDFNTDIVTEDITLISKWTPTKYKARFYADNQLKYTVEFTVEDNVLSSVPSVPNKNGYSGEWEDYTLTTQDIRIDAVYTLLTYTITYNNLNGALNSNPTSYTVNSQTITLAPLTSNTSVFEGWYNVNNELVTSIPSGSLGNISLTAKWTGKCNVIFDSDGGSTVPSQLVAPGEKASAPTTPPTKDGYSFVGWYYENEEWSFENDTVTTDVTLIALWQIIEYDAVFYANGSYVGTVKYTVVDNALSSIPAIPSRNGYTAKWEAYTLTLGGITVNAEYSKITYHITYAGLNGATNPNTIESYTVESEKITFSNPSTRNGYTFLGWFDKDDNKITEIATGSYGDLALTARWQLKTYTITYNGLNGANNDGNPSTYTIESSTIVFLAPTLNGYTFSTWETNDGTPITQLPTGSYGNLVLNAVWSHYTLNTSTNIENAGTYTQYTYEKVTADTSITLTATVNLGYKFLGWYSGSNRVSGVLSYTFDMPKENVDLVAKYELDSSLAGFEFTSTPTECIITGYTDKSVTALEIPAVVTKVQSNAFKGCMSLSTVTVKSSSTILEENAFWGCIYLTKINVAGNVTPIKTYYTFEEFRAMSGEAQEEYYDSFLTASDFHKWFNKAREEYEESQNREEIGNDDEVNLG